MYKNKQLGYGFDFDKLMILLPLSVFYPVTSLLLYSWAVTKIEPTVWTSTVAPLYEGKIIDFIVEIIKVGFPQGCLREGLLLSDTI